MSHEIAEAQPPSMLALIARAASDPTVDVEKMKALLDMQERLENRQRETAFNEAFARLQPRLPRITKKGEVKYPLNKSEPDGPQKHAFYYARWEDIDDAIRPLLNEEGFSFSVDTKPAAAGGVIGTGSLLHIAGHVRSASIGPVPLDSSGGKNNLQAAGSTTSYIARYTAKMLLNLVFEGEDDDGVRGGMQPITQAQIASLEQEIRKSGSNLDAFLRFMEVEALADIQVDDYAKAINALMAKKRKAQNPQDAAEAPRVREAVPVENPRPDATQGNTVRAREERSLTVTPVQGKRSGFDWKATKEALIARAKQVENIEDFARLRRQNARTVDGLRVVDRRLWNDWNMESAEIERQLRERLEKK